MENIKLSAIHSVSLVRLIRAFSLSFCSLKLPPCT